MEKKHPVPRGRLALLAAICIGFCVGGAYLLDTLFG